MNKVVYWFGWIGLFLGLAFLATVTTGGMVRSISPFPSDSFFRRLSRATWWVSPVLVASAGACTAWAVRSTPSAAAAMLGVAAIDLALCWRWRPSRADELWLPSWLKRVRAAVRVQIRDAAAWRRQLLTLVVGVIVLIVAASLVPRG